MGKLQGGLAAAEIDAWLRGGGQVVAASERAARAVADRFHRARRAEGLVAWPAPNVRDWRSFVRDAWQESSRDGRLLLNGLQEQALWEEIVGASGQGSALLEGPRRRMAALAMQAHELLCSYAPQFLNAKARSAWQQDAAAFSRWLTEFDEACRVRNAISAARVPLELLPVLESNGAERPPLLLAGFDRLLPAQRGVLDAWGKWSAPQVNGPAERANFYEARDTQSELAACVRWCDSRLTENPEARLLIVTQNLDKRRGEIERAFLHSANCAARYEFSLGVPLSGVALARGALLVLRWLSEPLEEREIDWLFSTGQTASGDVERFALTGFMRAVRRSNRQRLRWGLEPLFAERASAELPRAWEMRMVQAKRRLDETTRRPQTPLAWAELIPELLQAAGWPGARPPASAEFQALRRWQQTVDSCASLGFDGRRMSWKDFLRALGRALDETVFAPESHDAPIQIAGPAESAGLAADAVWFMGANGDAWPATGSTHPLLPIEVQREAAMPHALPQLDWDLAKTMTDRLVCSTPEVCFSYARQSDGVEMRPSRIVAEAAGAAQPVPPELSAPEPAPPIAEKFEDLSRVPLHGDNAAGGSTVLTAQSQCPFKAFATARLGAQGWEPAQAGLTAAQRGQLLHAVLSSVWDRRTAGICTHAELVGIADLPAFVELHVSRVLADKMPAGVREEMPPRYIELEAKRLIGLVTEWLEYERTRVPFTVAETEMKRDAAIAGLNLHLRLDRVDELIDGTFLVIDYKTGKVSTKQWELPRPDDVQLPLYAGFALDRETQPVGGLAFATVRAGEFCFAGRVGDARATLLPTLGAATSLVKRKLSAEELMDWRDYIETMARNYLAGHAEVDPRQYPETCEGCDLQALCRVRESRAEGADADEEPGDA